MKSPLCVHPLSPIEQEAVEAGLRSSNAFRLRRCQILLASARGERVSVIARLLSCDEQTVRNAIHAFNSGGLAALQESSSRPHHIQRAFSDEQVEQLIALLHRQPRTFGKPTSVWTLDLLADVSYEQGLSQRKVTGETIRATLARFGIRWKRAKRWITSPDPEYVRKKHMRDRVIKLGRLHTAWTVGFLDETWWSRLSQPQLHAWSSSDQPLRLVEQEPTKEDADPKALACYGAIGSARHPLFLLVSYP